jgi:hypothetical protein
VGSLLIVVCPYAKLGIYGGTLDRIGETAQEAPNAILEVRRFVVPVQDFHCRDEGVKRAFLVIGQAVRNVVHQIVNVSVNSHGFLRKERARQADANSGAAAGQGNKQRRVLMGRGPARSICVDGASASLTARCARQKAGAENSALEKRHRQGRQGAQ